MAPSWRQEAFSLIDEEWDEDGENLAPSSAHSHDLSGVDGDIEKEESPQPVVDEVIFGYRFKSAGAELAKHARMLRGESGAVILPAIMDENLAISPGVSRINVDVFLLRNGIEFAHTNFHNVSNHMVMTLGNGFDITLWDHFNADGFGRRVVLNITRQNGDEVESLYKIELPDNYRTIAVVEKDLNRFLLSEGYINKRSKAA